MRLVLAYHGQPHSGWQHVGDGRSVQEFVEAAVARVLKAGGLVRLHASGRTDAGVHALAQVVHFDIPMDWRMSGRDWCRALNCQLPASIRVIEAGEVPATFHARKDAIGKHYRYRLCNDPILHPLEHGLAWHWPWPLDDTAIRAAAPVFLGSHDFSAFAAYRHDGTDHPPESGRNIRRIDRIEVAREGGMITFDIEGNGFLYKMVRLIVGALIHVGKGTLDARGLAAMFDCPQDATGRLVKSPLCAGAAGLYLVGVRY